MPREATMADRDGVVTFRLALASPAEIAIGEAARRQECVSTAYGSEVERVLLADPLAVSERGRASQCDAVHLSEAGHHTRVVCWMGRGADGRYRRIGRWMVLLPTPARVARDATTAAPWCETCQSLLDAIAAAREEQVALTHRLSDRSTELRARGDADEGTRVGRDAEEHRMAAVAIGGLWERCNAIVFAGGDDGR